MCNWVCGAKFEACGHLSNRKTIFAIVYIKIIANMYCFYNN